jgi:hypothetical protein
MKKGLMLTLLTVAIAMIGMKAMGMAPVITEIPSPIVGNENGLTDANLYVYPDAINLNNYVSDDTTTAANIIWSYTINSPKYKINNVAPIVVGTDNIFTAAGGTKRINTQVVGAELNTDGLANTITIRNSNLSPLGGTANPPGGSNGIIAAETQVCTLFASDGTTYSSTELFIYTDKNGWDRISTGQVTYPVVKNSTFEGTVDGFASATVAGTLTFNTGGNTALCIGAPLAGQNFGLWVSPYGYVLLTANTVYDIRATMSGSSTTAGSTPFWDIVVDNYSNDGSQGLNLYGCDAFFLDNQGGNNAVLTTESDFHVLFTPAAVATAAWNNATTGIFTTARDPNNDMRLQFRVLDVDSNGGITAGSDQGTLCLKNLTVTAMPLGNMQTLQAGMYDATTITDANGTGGGTTTVDTLLGSTVSFAGGDITITPSSGAQSVELVSIFPGDRTNDTGNPAGQVDNYPVAFDANTMYQVVAELTAPNANSVTNSFDVFWVGADLPTNEVIYESFTTNNAGQVGMPQVAPSQTFMAFYHSNKGTAATTSQWHFFRPKVVFGNNAGLAVGNNSGGVIVNSIKVNKVDF